MKPISVQVDEIMTGLNPSADNRLAADLGVKLSPEQDEVTPLVAIGPAGYTTNEKGEPVEVPGIDCKLFAELFAKMPHNEKCSFRQGLIYARYIVVGKVENWQEVHAFLESAEQRIKD